MEWALNNFISSPAGSSSEAFSAIEEVNREGKAIYDLVGAEKEETFLFCNSGIEAIEKVFLSLHLQRGKGRIIASKGEENFLRFYLAQLFQKGWEIILLPIDRNGQVDKSVLQKELERGADLVTLSWASSLLGVVQPIETIAKMCQEKGTLLHVDGTYVLGKSDIDFSKSGIDYLSFSGDMLQGPKGSGGLFVKAFCPLHPWISGGEKDALIARKLDVPSFLGLSIACKMAKDRRADTLFVLSSLRSSFEEKLLSFLPNVKILFRDVVRLPNTVVVSFPKIHAEAFLYYLNEEAIFASFGRGFYSSIANILIEASVEKEEAFSAISFSLPPTITEKEVLEAAKRIATVYQKRKTLFAEEKQ